MNTKLFETARAELLRSNVDKRHPFRLMQLATLGEYPEIRTVVKRNSQGDFGQIIFTDKRTAKCDELKRDNKASALFYHPKKKLQVRLRVTASFLDEGSPQYLAYLNQVKQSKSVKDYTTTEAPGTVLAPEQALQYFDKINLAVIRLDACEVEILQLSREGHERVLYKRDGDDWQANVLIP